ncbi:hypothetical protein [Paenibacillus sp. MMO-177]|uniref:hypothetical protein n=1 Tax=Paenibacillus sp. MMO-177 TaxID=3081289 RepID=UPI0030199EE7
MIPLFLVFIELLIFMVITSLTLAAVWDKKDWIVGLLSLIITIIGIGVVLKYHVFIASLAGYLLMAFGFILIISLFFNKEKKRESSSP